MLELLLLFLFSVSLLICIAVNINITIPLIFGFILFFGYGLFKKYSFKSMIKMSFSGIVTIKNLLYIFVLIGVMTSFWRAGGTVAFIVYYASLVFSPDIMVVASFLICSAVSMLMGTSMGTAATVGVICITMSNAMGIPPQISGGAIFAGIYYGDRASPMSSSALLVCELTKTNIYENVKNMLKNSLVPTVISVILYTVISFIVPASNVTSDIGEIFVENFSLNPLVLIPAAVIVVLSILRFNVKLNMAISIISCIPIIHFVQGIEWSEIASIALFGFFPENSKLSELIGGGGIVSMSSVLVVVCLSSCYAGIFEGTNYLESIKKHIVALSEKTTIFGSVVVTSILSSAVACNQTLSIMLTHQLCKDIEPDRSKLALYIENTSVIIAPLIPWSIASSFPLSTINAPVSSLFFAFFLFLIPAWGLLLSIIEKAKVNKTSK